MLFWMKIKASENAKPTKMNTAIAGRSGGEGEGNKEVDNVNPTPD